MGSKENGVRSRIANSLWLIYNTPQNKFPFLIPMPFKIDQHIRNCGPLKHHTQFSIFSPSTLSNSCTLFVINVALRLLA